MGPAIAGAPKTWEWVRRTESRLTPFYLFVGTPSRLTASQDFVAGKHVLPQSPSLFAPGAPPFPLAPCAAQHRGLRQALTLVLGDGFNWLPSKDLRAFGLRAYPQPCALRLKTRRLWPASDFGRAVNVGRYVATHRPPSDWFDQSPGRAGTGFWGWQPRGCSNSAKPNARNTHRRCPET